MTRIRLAYITTIACALGTACSDSKASPSTSTGGNPSLGGSSSLSPDTLAGGTLSSGGAVSSGGHSTSSGPPSSGGGTQTSTGTAPTGGKTATGGNSSATGGTKASGGNSSATGGTKASGGNSTTAGGSTHTGAWRVMPLGDSITGTTCYPQLLSKNLIRGGHTNFIFVGSNPNNQDCGADAPALNTEGHGGYLVTDLVGTGSHASELPTWCTTDKADMVLMHLGTNDVWGNQRTTAQILSAYSTVVSALRAANKNVVIFVAQIIPLNPSSCTTCDYAAGLDAQIPSWAAGLDTTDSPIFVVDLHSVFSPASIYVPNSTYTDDGVHPKPAGAQMMADKMYADLVARGYF